jgi:predicted metal-dependent phosphotriesterase family hydrolase
MLRRDFLAGVAFAPLTAGPHIMTVTGSIRPNQLGMTLPHEHLFSKFGADPEEPPVYDRARLLDTVVPYVLSLKQLGCQAIVDGTAAWFGRDPLLLREISTKTGVRIVTNTGIYGAANDRYVPKFVYDESAEAIAQRWIAEWRDGIGETRIRPGFIKLGVDAGLLSEVDRKLVTAAARVHRATGLPIAAHTGDNIAGAFDQITLLKEEKVKPSAWIWIHAHQVEDTRALTEAASQGAWVSLDGIEPGSIDRHIELIEAMRDLHLLDRVLLSHDGNAFRCCGRPPKPFDALFKEMLPILRKRLTPAEVRRLTVENPRDAFTVAVRA